MRVYLIVVTFNSSAWIDRCFANFKKLPEDWKVIIVDNASTDGSLGQIKIKYPHFIIIENKNNLGFGKANNIAMKMALQDDVDYVFLLNHDAWIKVEDIRRLIEIQMKHQEYLILSPVHLNGAGDRLDAGFGLYCSDAYCPNFYSDHVIGRTKEVYSSTMGNAAAWLLSRNCLQKIGGFNPVFDHYCEDDEYRDRVLYHGYKFGICSGIFANHGRENRYDKPSLKMEFACILKTIALLPKHGGDYSTGSNIIEKIKIFIRVLCLFRIRELRASFKTICYLCSKYHEIKINKKKVLEIGPSFLLGK